MAPAHKYMATTNKFADKIFDFKNKLEEQELSEKTKNIYLRILIEILHTAPAAGWNHRGAYGRDPL